jgi:hypothetical protein
MRQSAIGLTTVQTILTDLSNGTYPLPAVKHNVVVRHEPRPPAPVPIRLQIVWIMQDGQELRQYINMYGQSSTTERVPDWMIIRSVANPTDLPSAMRFEFQYENGNRI